MIHLERLVILVLSSLVVACAGGTPNQDLLYCGNGRLNGTETCDGTELGGASCASLGLGIGTLACSDQCQYVTTGCHPGQCGDGLLLDGEACDDGNLYFGDGCSPSCKLEAGWACAGEPSRCVAAGCGNGIAEPEEDCDGSDLGTGTCASLGLGGGELACQSFCLYDTTGCGGADCGNGVLDAGEACDGTLLHGETCATLDQGDGTLGCTDGCVLDLSGCSGPPCGDGVKDAGEACDGSDLGGATCTSLGLGTGTVSCDAGCELVTTGCVTAVCGNGQVEGAEACDDGNAVSGDGCSSLCQWEAVCTANGAIACGGSVSGDLSDSNSSVSGYSCGGSSTGDEDEIFSFVAGASGNATVSLDVESDGGLDPDDFDLYVMSGTCNPSRCVAVSANSGDDSVTFPVTAGMTYYISVELYDWGFLTSNDYRVYLLCP